MTPAARDAYRLILLPPMKTWVRYLTPAQPAWGTLAGLAVALLPQWARRMYSLPGLGLTDAAATAGAEGLPADDAAAPAARPALADRLGRLRAGGGATQAA